MMLKKAIHVCSCGEREDCGEGEDVRDPERDIWCVGSLSGDSRISWRSVVLLQVVLYHTLLDLRDRDCYRELTRTARGAETGPPRAPQRHLKHRPVSSVG